MPKMVPTISAVPFVVDIPAGVDSIGQWAFFGCRALQDVQLHEGLRAIGTFAFDSCLNLHHITLPSTLTLIGDQGFAETFSLDTIVLLSTIPPTIFGSTFIHHSATLVVPCGSAAAYRQHEHWHPLQDSRGTTADCWD